MFGHFCVVYDSAVTNAAGYPLAFPLRRDRLGLCPSISPDHPYPRVAENLDTSHHPPRSVHPLRALAHARDRDCYTALRPCSKREWQLPDIHTETAIYRNKCGDTTISDPVEYMQLLEGSILIRDSGNSVLSLYDGVGLAGPKR